MSPSLCKYPLGGKASHASMRLIKPFLAREQAKNFVKMWNILGVHFEIWGYSEDQVLRVNLSKLGGVIEVVGLQAHPWVKVKA